MSCSDWPFIPAIPFWDCISNFLFRLFQRCCFEVQRIVLLLIKTKETRRKGMSDAAFSCRLSLLNCCFSTWASAVAVVGTGDGRGDREKVDATHGRKARQTRQHGGADRESRIHVRNEK